MPEIGIGMVGYAFMGKAHSHAYRELAYLASPPPVLLPGAVVRRLPQVGHHVSHDLATGEGRTERIDPLGDDVVYVLLVAEAPPAGGHALHQELYHGRIVRVAQFLT